LSSIATPIARGNIGPSIKKYVNDKTAELRDEVLFKDPPAKEDCPICFLPMPLNFIHCILLPPATIASVPIYDYAMANEELANPETRDYDECCGKSICTGCIYSFVDETCPLFCKAEISGETENNSPSWKFYLPAAFLDTVLPKMVDFP
jgi:hypothetical protein